MEKLLIRMFLMTIWKVKILSPYITLRKFISILVRALNPLNIVL